MKGNPLKLYPHRTNGGKGYSVYGRIDDKSFSVKAERGDLDTKQWRKVKEMTLESVRSYLARELFEIEKYENK